MRVKKLMLKVLDEDIGKEKWVHICYIGSVLYNSFLQTFGINSVEFADYVSLWVKQDFNLSLNMSTKRDVAIMKATICEKYRVLYPTIYNNTTIDTQGWVRVWLTQKMEKELKNV